MSQSSYMVNLAVELTTFLTRWLTHTVYETKEGFTVHWLVVAFHWVRIRVRARVYIIQEYVNHVVEKAVEYPLILCSETERPT